MAEKKRGLGRGLGALIPDVVSDERPVDVFFPSSKEDDGDVSRETSTPRTSKDPALSMQRAHTQRKKAAPVRGRAARGESSSSESASSVSTKTANGDAGSAADSSFAGVSTDSESSTGLQTVPGTAFGMLDVSTILPNPRQPRTVFDEDALDELVHSIKEVGVLQPIVVRVVDSSVPTYELVMGERRLRASKEAGAATIPAIIREVAEVDLLRDALLENLHRADLNPLEEAAAYRQLLDDFQCTQEELSQRIGRSRPQIANTLRLLKLPALVQRRVAAGVISQGHARAILGLDDGAEMETLAQRVVAEGLSVRATEEAVVLANRGDDSRASRSAPKEQDPALTSLARTLGDRLDTRVNISMGKNKGRLSVEFADQDDLQRILGALGMAKGSSGPESSGRD